MKRYSITKTATFLQAVMRSPLIFLGCLFLAGTFLGNVRDDDGVIVWYAALLTLLISVLMVVMNRHNLRHHAKKAKEYAENNGLGYTAELPTTVSALAEASVFDLRGARLPKTSNIVEGPGWCYADLTYRIYKQARYGDYHARTVYYSVLCMDLPRKLPNVFFDSKHARKRQFRFHFDKSQSLSFEGNFDDHFVTYCPDGYEIDSLSFLSPDVLQAILAAKNYDLEIKNDKLYLYDSLRDPSVQIDTMIKILDPIKKQLLDNILTYRDERVARSEGRKIVSISGISLKRSKFWAIVEICAAIIVVAFCLVISLGSKLLK